MNIAEEMRDIVRIYKSGFEKSQKKYIEKLHKEIKCAARIGNRSIETIKLGSVEWFTKDYYNNLKQLFESEGFEVREESSHTGWLTSWLRIIW